MQARRIIPLVVFVLSIFFLNQFFNIRYIKCTLNNEPCPVEIQTVLGKLNNTNSLFVNQKEQLANIKNIYPVDKISIGFKPFNTLNVSLNGNSQYIQVDVYLVNNLPVLSMDQAPSSTDSAGWWVKPTGELEDFVRSHEPLGFNLWENGTMTSVATSGAKISYIFSQKPSEDTIISLFKIINLIHKYTDASAIYIVDTRCFLSRAGQPDIIVSVPFDEASLSQALQSISYLDTIKKDTKVIDFSFKNPIIK